MARLSPTAPRCNDCGAVLYDAGEYHPAAFCALVRGGFDPWQVVRIIAGHLDLGDPGDKPPLVTETRVAS